MNIIFVIPTYDNDGTCAVQAARGILALGVAAEDVRVCVQRGKDLRAPELEKFAAMGVHVAPSRYTRRDRYTDLIAKLQLYACHDGDWTICVDSDTVINDLARYLSAAADPNVMAASTAWAGCGFAGCSSMVRVAAARRALRDVLEDNSQKFPASGLPDDVAIGELIGALYGEGSVVRWPSPSLGWYDFTKNWDEMAAKGAVHFGQKKLAREHAKGKPVRDVIAEHMAEFLDWKAGR